MNAYKLAARWMSNSHHSVASKNYSATATVTASTHHIRPCCANRRSVALRIAMNQDQHFELCSSTLNSNWQQFSWIQTAFSWLAKLADFFLLSFFRITIKSLQFIIILDNVKVLFLVHLLVLNRFWFSFKSPC